MNSSVDRRFEKKQMYLTMHRVVLQETNEEAKTPQGNGQRQGSVGSGQKPVRGLGKKKSVTDRRFD